MAKTPKKSEAEAIKDNAPKESENRKINPWIPIAVVGFIVALIAVMALMSNNNSTTTTNNTTPDQAASGTTQSGGTSSGESVDVSWITQDTTPTQITEKTGIPAKMLQQFLGISEADMGKPFSALGGAEAVASAQSLVSQFGGGAMGGGSSGGSTGAPGGMGGTPAP